MRLREKYEIYDIFEAAGDTLLPDRLDNFPQLHRWKTWIDIRYNELERLRLQLVLTALKAQVR